MKRLALLPLLLSSPALMASLSSHAQAPSPAQMGITQGTPQSLQYLDKDKHWVPLNAGGDALDPRSFGAKCDGVTNDTAALQAWLNQANAGRTLSAPPGTCLFSSPLTIGAVSNYTVRGSGPRTTIFRYNGANTTNDLLTINAPAAGTVTGITLRDFSIVSATVMTGGFAFHAHGLFSSTISDVWTDNTISNDPIGGNLCGGFWFNGAGGVTVINPRALSKQNCGDGLRVNGALGGVAALNVLGGDIGGIVNGTTNVVSGFTAGFHMAGGFGGLQCDNSNIHNNLVGTLIDRAVTGTANREFLQGSTCANDSNQNAAIQINDPINDAGAVVDLAGWNAGTQTGPGVLVTAFGGTINLRGSMLYLNCGDGIDIEDNITNVLVSPALQIFKNGPPGLGSGCLAWQGAHPGHGWGIYAGVVTGNVSGSTIPTGNSAGAISPNVLFKTTVGVTQSNALTVTSTAADAITVSNAGATGIGLMNAGVLKWDLRNNAGNAFIIQDSSVPANWLTLTTGGAATIGATNTSVTSFTGPIRVPSFLVANLPTCNAGANWEVVGVPDALAPTYNATLTGGGAVRVLALCNGTNWVAH